MFLRQRFFELSVRVDQNLSLSMEAYLGSSFGSGEWFLAFRATAGKRGLRAFVVFLKRAVIVYNGY